MSMKKEKTSTKKTVVDVKKIMAAWTVGCQPPEAAPRCRDSRLGLIKEGDKKKQSRNPSVLDKKTSLTGGCRWGIQLPSVKGCEAPFHQNNWELFWKILPLGVRQDLVG